MLKIFVEPPYLEVFSLSGHKLQEFAVGGNFRAVLAIAGQNCQACRVESNRMKGMAGFLQRLGPAKLGAINLE